MLLIKYYAILKEKNTFSFFKLISMGLIAGISGTLLLIIINQVLQLDPGNKTFYPKLFLGFTAITVIHFVIQVIYQASLIKLSQSLIWKVREQALNNIRHADFLKFHYFGSNKIYNILNTDAANISRIGQMMSTLIVSAVTILSCLVYLAWLTPAGCLISLVVMTATGILHIISSKKFQQQIKEVKETEDHFGALFVSLFEGLKELKLDQKKSDDLFNNYILKAGVKARQLRTEIDIRFFNNNLLGQIFFFSIIGLFLFIFPLFHFSFLSNSPQYVLVTLYIMTPAATIGNFIADFHHAGIGLDRFTELKQLEEIKETHEPCVNGLPSTPHSISFHDVNFGYEPHNDEQKFTIGPLNFQLLNGEIVFLSGGNGSGKTTLIRLLTGLYFPISGTIKTDNAVVTKSCIKSYRSLFSTVYTDNYVFENILGMEGLQDRKISAILEELGLAAKVKCINNTFSSVDLSYGQKKRLALAIALLENKEVYVFDELAANQDANFREYFYTTILKRLKDQGKIVLVVTHDDKYFHIADKHYKMESGNITLYEKFVAI